MEMTRRDELLMCAIRDFQFAEEQDKTAEYQVPWEQWAWLYLLWREADYDSQYYLPIGDKDERKNPNV